MNKDVPATIDEAYEQVKAQVMGLAAKFWRGHGGDLDEWRAEANLHFCRAYRTWQPERGKLTTWTHWVVWTGLLEEHRRRCTMDRARKLIINGELDHAPARRDRAGELAGKLDVDGLRAVSLALACRHLHMAGKRKELVELLIDLGWSGVRIQRVFAEVREAL